MFVKTKKIKKKKKKKKFSSTVSDQRHIGRVKTIKMRGWRRGSKNSGGGVRFSLFTIDTNTNKLC